MKYPLFVIALFVFAMTGGCGEAGNKGKIGNSGGGTVREDPPKYDPNRGKGQYGDSGLFVGSSINEVLAREGKTLAEIKCFSCHKITHEKLVGPGWSGVTIRRKPAWIMNFITNPDAMLKTDPVAQSLLEICLVRMPDQNLSGVQARQLLEFMRKNDLTNKPK